MLAFKTGDIFRGCLLFLNLWEHGGIEWLLLLYLRLLPQVFLFELDEPVLLIGLLRGLAGLNAGHLD